MVLDHDGSGVELLECPNVPGLIAAAVSIDRTLIGPLCSILSVEDLWDVLEVATVDAHNRRAIQKAADGD